MSIDWAIPLTLLHLLGAILGAGGAYVSDFMFLQSIKDGRLSKTEMIFLELGSKVVWVGLLILVISGLGLFSLDTTKYLASDKFWAKQTVVLIIILNGLAFHRYHIPLLRKHLYERLAVTKEFLRYRQRLVASGVISVVSWTSALFLGSWRTMTYSYSTIMMSYLIVLCVVFIVTYFMKSKLLARLNRP